MLHKMYDNCLMGSYFSGLEITSICTKESTLHVHLMICSSLRSLTQYHTPARYNTLEEFIREEWEARFLTGWDANDLLGLLKTWQIGDVSFVRDGGDLAKCLGAIRAKGLIMASKSDLLFPVNAGIHIIFRFLWLTQWWLARGH